MSARRTGTDAGSGSRLEVVEVVGHLPDERRLRLDVLGPALALPRAAVDEAGDTVALLDVGDARADLVDRPM